RCRDDVRAGGFRGTRALRLRRLPMGRELTDRCSIHLRIVSMSRSVNIQYACVLLCRYDQRKKR
ncbi:MAG TPA: hypothetical protein VJ724_12355, partial [Tahibacter sp.]|nr:hypothetical protein [Tahibacter sp.]